MIQALSFLLVGVILSTAGELLLKHGVNSVSNGQPLELWPLPDLTSTLFRLFTNFSVLGGFVMVFGASIFWLAVLSRLDLSVAYPMLSVSYIVVVLLSWLIFRESVSPMRLAGVVVIIVGVAIIGISYQQDQSGKEAVVKREAAESRR